MVLTAVYLGRPDLGAIGCGYLASALLAGAYLAVGMATSALTRNQVISFIISVVVGLFLVLAGYPPVTELIGRFAPIWLVNGVAAFASCCITNPSSRGCLTCGISCISRAW
jgi:ABC-2 type transport system permease protein